MKLILRNFMLITAVACGLTVAGCAGTAPDEAQAPAQPDTFTWFDLGSDDPDVSRAFYEDLFGWRIKPRSGGDYWTITAEGTPIGGMFRVSGDDTSEEVRSQWIPVFGVSDALETYKAALTMGARQAGPPARTSDGDYATIFDPTGAALDLYDGGAGLPISQSGAVGTWIWADHISDDPNRAARFYASLFGYESGRSAGGERVLRLDGKDLGGLVDVPGSQAEPNWLPYVAVADIGETLTRSAALGGRVLARDERAAILLDPTGAAIGVISEGNDG